MLEIGCGTKYWYREKKHTIRYMGQKFEYIQEFGVHNIDITVHVN